MNTKKTSPSRPRKTPLSVKAGTGTGVPRYRAIHDTLRQRIVSGEWPPGHKLPPEPELAKKFGCARMTVSKAIGALADRGLVTRRRRAGTTVNEPRYEESVLEIHDIEAEIKASEHAYQFECSSRTTRKATQADAQTLGIPQGTSILALTGLHRADGRPHAFEERLINLEAVPAARKESFDDVSPGRWLLGHIPWTDAEHRIYALNSDVSGARALGIRPGTACLCIERRTRLDDMIVTSVRLVYPCDRHRLVASFRSRGT